MNTRDIFSQYTHILERNLKGRMYLFAAIFMVAFLVAIGQSNQFASSLWVVTKFGFDYWEEPIHIMIDDFYWWAIISGVFASMGAVTNLETTEPIKFLKSLAIGFGIGFALTYLFIFVLAVILYIPLGVFSFVFPDQVSFLSMGFAFLCSTYIVFTIIALDTPLFLIDVIKTAPIYFKLLAVLLGLLLASQILSMVLSILRILMEYSFWRVQPLAFILAFGGSFLASILINLKLLRDKSKYMKVAIISSVFLLSVMTGNISENLFHWGESVSALVAAFVGPIAYSFLFYKIQGSFVRLLSIFSGAVCGLGTGFFIATYSKLSIIGQGWFGILCGTSIAIGFGISFGFLLGPRIGALITKVFRFRPIVGMLVTVGFIVGTIAGFVSVGFANR